MKFYAHLTQGATQTDWQTLPTHLIGVEQLASECACWFGGESLQCAHFGRLAKSGGAWIETHCAI